MGLGTLQLHHGLELEWVGRLLAPAAAAATHAQTLKNTARVSGCCGTVQTDCGVNCISSDDVGKMLGLVTCSTGAAVTQAQALKNLAGIELLWRNINYPLNHITLDDMGRWGGEGGKRGLL